MPTNKTIREEFEEKFELERQGCLECGGFMLIDKTEIRYPKSKYHCEYDLDKVISFIEKALLTQLEEEVEGVIEDFEDSVQTMATIEIDDTKHTAKIDLNKYWDLRKKFIYTLKEKKN